MTRGLASFARSGAWSVVAQGIQIAGAIGLSVVVVRTLSTELYGTLSVARLATHLVVIGSGFALERVSLRFLPELWERSGSSGARSFFWQTLAVRVASWGVTVVLVFALSGQLQNWLGIDWQAELRVGVLTALVFSLHLHVRAAATARFATQSVALGNAVAAIGTFVATVIFLRLGEGVIGVLWGAAIGVGLSALVQLPAALGPRQTGEEPETRIALSSPRFLSYAAPFAGIAVLNHLVHSQTEVYFLARFHGEEAVGYFNLGFTFAQRIIDFLPLALWEVSMAGFSHLVVREPERIPGAVYSYLTLLYLAIVPIALGGVAFSGSLIRLLYTEAFDPAIVVSQAYFVIAAIAAFNAPIGMILYAKERSGAALGAYLLFGAVNLGLDLALIPSWGLWGAIVGLGVAKLLNVLLFARLVWRMVPDLRVPWRLIARAVVGSAPVLLWLLVAPRLTDGWWLVPGLALGVGLVVLGYRLAGVIGIEEAKLVSETNLPLRRPILRLLASPRVIQEAGA